MLKKRVKQIITALLMELLLFLFLPCVQPAYGQEHTEKQILILNSYHQGLVWTEEETNGVMDKIRGTGKNRSFFVEYMDWKNYNSEINWNNLYNYYKYKYADKKIDLIITTDDTALRFALRYRKEMFSNAPVVFCGVNKEGIQTITEGYDRVTGVIEEVDPTETVLFAKKINPFLKNIYLIYDNSESGLSTGKIATAMIKASQPDINIIPWNDLSFETVKKYAGQLKNDSMILFGSYFSDVDKNVIAMDYATREVSKASSVPVYSLYDFSLNEGIIGGTMLSGRLQGEYAAELAIRILDGEDPNTIPILKSNSYRSVFDYNQLKRHRIPLKLLPPGSSVINKPFSFYETYKTLVLSVAAAFILLFVFVNVLLIYVRRLRKMRRALSENNEELTQLNEELIASDEEMKQQYDEIISINEKIKLSEEKLVYLAYHDSMTGLPNKLSLYEDAKKLLTSDNKTMALLFIDIDNFKYVNDTLGHAFGDKLIVEVSERLIDFLPENCSLYRLSGDEFIIILDCIDDVRRAEEYAAFLLSGFFKDFDYQSNLRISLSIGIAMYPEHGTDLEELLKYADIAMYLAKDAGKKGYVVYNSKMNEAFTERVSIEKYLKKALDNKEFELYYQPQLDLKTNRITGFEALLRWNSPELGQVPTMKFISVAEDTHFIIPLGDWVLQNACIFLKRLEELGYRDLGVSVNISILQLLQEDFVDKVLDMIDTYRIKPECLELEVTESILVESFERIKAKLQKLRDCHVRIALDDFGKGYSSLSYLKQLPITTMKIDKSFIDFISEQNEDDFVRNIISLGKDLGMCVIAEGVEVKHQLDYLLKNECDKIQGFLFCKPKTESDIILMIMDMT